MSTFPAWMGVRMGSSSPDISYTLTSNSPTGRTQVTLTGNQLTPVSEAVVPEFEEKVTTLLILRG